MDSIFRSTFVSHDQLNGFKPNTQGLCVIKLSPHTHFQIELKKLLIPLETMVQSESIEVRIKSSIT